MADRRGPAWRESGWRNVGASPEALCLALLTVAGLGLRLIHLGRMELWVDEAATWWFAHQIWEGGVSLLRSPEPTPPIYYGLMALWMRLVGETDWLLRLPSALAGAATIPLLYDLARRLASRRVGWIAAILLCIHPLHIFYSREARVYAPLLLLTVALFITLWRALERQSWRAWALFGVVLFAICCLHVSGFFLGVTVGLQILVVGKSWRQRWRGLLVAALAGLALLPYLWFALPQLEGSGAANSVEKLYQTFPEEGRLGRSLEMQLIGADYFVFLRQMDRPPTPTTLRWWALLANVSLLMLALWRPARPRASLFLAMGWLISILVPWTLSRTWQVFFHPGRHDFYTVGVVTVLVAMGLDRLWRSGVAGRRGSRWRRGWLVFCCSGLIVGAGFRLFALHTQPTSDFYRGKGQWLAEQAKPGDTVIATGILRPIVQHYVRLEGNLVSIRSFPSSTDRHAGWSDDRALLDNAEDLKREAKQAVASAVEQEASRVFVLLRKYRRVGNAMSVSWWVDQTLIQALHDAGWQPLEWPQAAAQSMAVFEPPKTDPNAPETISEEPP